MSRPRTPTALLTLCLALLTASVAHAVDDPPSDQQARNYILATATPGGTFYPVGRALATLTTAKIPPAYKVSMSAIESAGSGENIKLLRRNKAQFAILGGLYGAWAWHGAGPEKRAGKMRELRSITMLWADIEHFVVSADRVKTGTVADLNRLAGRKFSIGERGSGTEATGLHILHALGINSKALSLARLGYGASGEALIQGRIEGMNTPAGLPVAAVTHVFEVLGGQVRILDFNDQQLAAINRKFPLWTPTVIPANTYPGQDQPVNTVAQPNFLAVRADVDEDVVYRMTAAIYANIPYLNGMHPATIGMRTSRAINGLPAPLHPGALRYYRERGLDIPAELIAP